MGEKYEIEIEKDGYIKARKIPKKTALSGLATIIFIVIVTVIFFKECSPVSESFQKTGIITEVQYGYTDGGLNWWWTYPFPKDKEVKLTKLTFDDGTKIVASGYPNFQVVPGNKYKIEGIRHRPQPISGYNFDVQSITSIAK